jgi:hypothetical protein
VTVTATTLEGLVRPELTTALSAYLTSIGRDPSSAFFPTAAGSPSGGTPTPFLVTRYGPITGDAGFMHGSFSTYIYDNTEQRYWRIEDMVNILRKYFNRFMLGPTIPGSVRWLRTYHQVTSGHQTDDAWNLNLMLIRFDVYGTQV